MVEHNTLTGSDVHEPKAASTASAGTVYVFDGAGSGTARKITEADLNIVASTGSVLVAAARSLETIGTGGAWSDVVRITVPYGGTYESTVRILGSTLSVRWRVNGVQQGSTQSVGSGTAHTLSQTLSVNAGDIITFEFNKSGTASLEFEYVNLAANRALAFVTEPLV